jgi:hypothetical protein
MKMEAHFISSQSYALVYLFHELGYEASLVGIAAILPHLRLLIQQNLPVLFFSVLFLDQPMFWRLL